MVAFPEILRDDFPVRLHDVAEGVRDLRRCEIMRLK